MQPLVDIYCRTAVDGQEGNMNLDEQEAAGRQYCLENGLTIGVVYRDVFSGSQYRERSGLKKMRVRYLKGEIQGIVVCNMDRLSRSQVHLIILLEEMERYNVTLHTVKERLDDSPMGKLMRMMVALMIEVEREKTLDRLLTE